jgi:hypothetical protein
MVVGLPANRVFVLRLQRLILDARCKSPCSLQVTSLLQITCHLCVASHLSLVLALLSLAPAHHGHHQNSISI